MDFSYRQSFRIHFSILHTDTRIVKVQIYKFELIFWILFNNLQAHLLVNNTKIVFARIMSPIKRTNKTFLTELSFNYKSSIKYIRKSQTWLILYIFLLFFFIYKKSLSSETVNQFHILPSIIPQTRILTIQWVSFSKN